LSSHDLAAAVFAGLCHQQLDRAWIVGGTALALCARCTGVYAGAAFGLFALPFLRTRPSRLLVAVHVAAVLQMVVLGTHLWPPEQAAWLRTLSGQVFVTGVIFLLWAPIRAAWLERAAANAGAPGRGGVVYGAAVVAAWAGLQLLIRCPAPWAALVLEWAALGGLVVLGSLALVGVRSCISASRTAR
jgi:uncharacterized membrane protein